MPKDKTFDRRGFLGLVAAAVGAPLTGCMDSAEGSKGRTSASSQRQRTGQISPDTTVDPVADHAGTPDLITRTVPSTGAAIPVIGMGTWITFNVGEDTAARNERTNVLQAFFEGGGGMIDSSPMYGSSEEVVGYGLRKLGYPDGLFSATKVWTPLGQNGDEQVRHSYRLWGVERFDLLQVHNLVDWREHLEMLFEMKENGRLRHVGITTSHGRRHSEMEDIMSTHPLDFVQLTYNLVDREAERRLLPLAADRGIAVIANRPYRGGQLVDRMQRRPLPEWASEFDAANWPQLLLKYIVSHPAVTTAIPATTQVVHMRENMGAARGRLPDARMRKRIVDELA